jgi:hypothetical protein
VRWQVAQATDPMLQFRCLTLPPQLPEKIATQSPIARAWRAFEHALDNKTKQAAIAA